MSPKNEIQKSASEGLGNPVFTYRAGFRRLAGRIQQVLLIAGFVLAVIGGFFYALGGASSDAKIGLDGLFVILLGIAWGFYWRKKIREEFMDKFQ
jgi:membrane protease YdiL (CAAX protease family)